MPNLVKLMMYKVYKAIDVQCHIQSYFETGIPVWDPKLRSQTLENVRINSSKYRQMILHAQVPQCDLSVLSYSECKITIFLRGFAPGAYWGGLTALYRTSQLHNGFSPGYARRKTATPKKLLETALANEVWTS